MFHVRATGSIVSRLTTQMFVTTCCTICRIRVDMTMMRGILEDGARVRAAQAYAGLTLEALAAETGIGRDTLQNLRGKRTRTARAASLEETQKIAAACGVPFEWFTADFSRLWEIVPEGLPVLARPRDEARPAKSPPLPGTDSAGPQRGREAS